MSFVKTIFGSKTFSPKGETTLRTTAIVANASQRGRRLASVILFTGMLINFAGCKIKYGFKGITIPPEAKTISVEMFKNQADLTAPAEPQLLSQKLRDAVSSQTNLAMIKQNGDLKFEECRITAYTNNPQAIGSTDQNALRRLSVTITINYVNKFDISKGFTDRQFTRYFDYDGSKTLSAVESDGLEQINRQLIEDIFNAAFNNW
ncbi:MAG TPA: LPS assembly lipoprotein LptE [Bacteroidia bacterium]|nr:LPS assembly lipoprotein LptE [Bacteroidia bacterium]